MEKQATLGLIGSPAIIPATKVRYALYARKSTEESSERQVLSIDSQVKEMLSLAEREGLEIVDIRREAHSAKDPGQRPVFNEIINDIKNGRYNGLLAWDVSRIGRCVSDLAKILDFMDQKQLIEIRTYGQKFTNTPAEKFLFMILGSQAKLENDHKSINVKRGLRTRCEMGLRPGQPPVGYLNERHMDRKCQAIIDPERGPTIKKMFEKVAYEKWSGGKIYNWLKFELNFKSVTGNKGLTLGNIYLILQNPFYYGIFEYPVKSGNFYTGKHTPLITRELFDQVQTQVKSQIIKSESKEFAFTKLMTCGLCGSGITADEKFKKQKNGNIHRHVYYGCTKVRDRGCKCGYINEVDLLKQFEALMNTIDLDEIGIKEKLKAEVERVKKFQGVILCTKEKIEVKDVDIRNYAKYLLQEGSDVEKREILSCLTSKIELQNKQISLRKN